MDKNTEYVGIDISKDCFDVFNPTTGHQQFPNNDAGFKQLLKTLGPQHWIALESTGSYSQRLSIFLFEQGIRVSVLNPLTVKRYIQMKLRYTKTDKADARMIAQYASEQPMKPWQPDPVYIDDCKMIQATVAQYLKQSTALKNKLKGFDAKAVSKKSKLYLSVKRQLRSLQKEIKLLEQELEQLIKQNEPQMLTQLTSIPGIGRKTAILLIVHTNGFRSFQNHRQVAAFLGLAPTQRISGSSIRGRSRITKMGNSKLRNHLFLCSFTAHQCNPQCRALYNRLVAKGKSKKLALVAVTNKLIKQAFAISKSQIPFDKHYRSTQPIH